MTGPRRGAPDASHRHATAPQPTREAPLHAGHRLLVEHPADEVFAHLTVGRVVSAAGHSTDAFLRHWATREDYLRDLIAYGMHPDRSVALDATAEALGVEIDRGASPAEALIAAGRSTPRVTASSPQNVLELLVWNRGLHDEEFRAEVAHHYPHLDKAAGALCAVFIDMLGRELREPFTIEIVAAVCSAVAQGLGVRDVLTPGFYPDEIYGWTILTLAQLMTRAPDDPRNAAEFVADLQLQHEPATGATTGVDARPEQAAGDSLSARSRF